MCATSFPAGMVQNPQKPYLACNYKNPEQLSVHDLVKLAVCLHSDYKNSSEHTTSYNMMMT